MNRYHLRVYRIDLLREKSSGQLTKRNLDDLASLSSSLSMDEEFRIELDKTDLGLSVDLIAFYKDSVSRTSQHISVDCDHAPLFNYANMINFRGRETKFIYAKDYGCPPGIKFDDGDFTEGENAVIVREATSTPADIEDDVMMILFHMMFLPLEGYQYEEDGFFERPAKVRPFLDEIVIK
jgi:hypothetical protein